MKIYSFNLRDYYLARLCVSGELPILGLPNIEGYSYAYAANEIQTLKQDKIIRQYIYPDGRRFYRLSDPAGTEALEKLPNELRQHIDMMVGKQQERYKRDKNYRLKQRRIFEIADLFARNGVSVDLISIRDPQNIKNDSRLKKQSYGPSIYLAKQEGQKTFRSILELIEPDEPVFLTNKVIHEIRDKFNTHPKEHMFRATGILIKGLNIYSAYYFDSAKEVWWKDVESDLALQMIRFAKMHLEAYKEMRGPGYPMKKAIFYTRSAKQAIEFIDEKKATIKPNDVYNLAYIIPIRENAFDISSMLLERNWKQKLDYLLFSEPAKRGEICDGYIEQVPGYNLLCINLAEFRKKMEHLKNKPGYIFTHDWIADYVRENVSEKAEVISVKEDDFRQFYKAVKNM